MKTKKITAPTVTEAMSKVKKELGSDAIILYTRKIKRTRWLPPFRKDIVEIVAALDEEPRVKVKDDDPPTKVSELSPNAVNESIFTQALEKQIQSQLSEKPKDIKPITKNERDGSEWSGTTHLFPEEIKTIYHKLIENDFYPETSDQLTKELLKQWYSSSESLNREDLKERLYQLFNDHFTKLPFEGRSYKTRLITLVGPTGVGKTTTAAKIASKAVLEDEKRVAFITTDTYRIAAVEQLKTYAKILNVPISVVYSMEDFQEALRQFKDVDLIIVDSAGRNYQQKKYVNELLQLIPFHDQMETYLVLSATSKTHDLERITSQFSTLPISNFLFTKVDETLSIGNLCQLMLRNNYGVSYFTNGQDVPDDILEGDRDAFIKQLVERIIHE